MPNRKNQTGKAGAIGKKRERIEQFLDGILSGLAIGMGGFFIIVIVLGILGSWISISWWASVVVLSVIFLVFSYRGLGKRAFKVAKVVVLVGFLILFPLFSANLIISYQGSAQNLTNPKETTYFRNLLGRSYNYTELYLWQNSTLHWNNSSSMTFYSDPIQIYEYGQARCGGYAILYAELCISQGYEARIVVSVFGDHVWNEVKLNGTWTRIDASPTGAPMNENIGFPLFYEQKWNTPPILALSFENSTVADVTSSYRSDGWSLLSWLTVIFAFIFGFFAFCIGLIWKTLFGPFKRFHSQRI